MYDAYGSSRGSPHSSHSVTVSGSVGSLMVLTMSTKGTSATAARKRSGRIVMQAPDEQAAGAAAADRHPVAAATTGGHEVLARREGVGERVALVQQLAVEVPLPAELAAAARVDERPRPSPVEQREAAHREPRRHRDLVAP
jgi:hypothetical protein